jgi:hypothetical protein
LAHFVIVDPSAFLERLKYLRMAGYDSQKVEEFKFCSTDVSRPYFDPIPLYCKEKKEDIHFCGYSTSIILTHVTASLDL